MNKKVIIIGSIAVVLVGGALAAYFLWWKKRDTSSMADYSESDVIPTGRTAEERQRTTDLLKSMKQQMADGIKPTKITVSRGTV